MKFRNKYRIESARNPKWDYTSPGAYFVTINVRYHNRVLGCIKNGNMELSNAGVCAESCWREISHHYSNVGLGEYVIMPSHVHGIVIIRGKDEKGFWKDLGTDIETGAATDTCIGKIDGTLHTTFIHPPKNYENCDNTGKSDNPRHPDPYMSSISPPAGSLPAIIRSYKSAVSKMVHQFFPDFEWQARFHDRIIRDIEEYDRITKYIHENPVNWD